MDGEYKSREAVGLGEGWGGGQWAHCTLAKGPDHSDPYLIMGSTNGRDFREGKMVWLDQQNNGSEREAGAKADFVLPNFPDKGPH